MTIWQRSSQTREQQEQTEFLQSLIETPIETPSAAQHRTAPVTLRSLDEQREHALRGFLRRTWVDGVLKHAERFLVLVAVVVFGVWFIDGPVRDWWYLHANAAESTVVPPVADSVIEVDQNAPLPFITADMETSAPMDDFIAPRNIAPAAPAVVAEQPNRLLIPAIDLDTPVHEVFIVDGAWEVADYAAGFLNGTALPGEDGNTALAGHAGIRGAVFRDLGRLNVGDEVFVDAGGWRYQYRIRSSTAVWPTQTEVLHPSETPILTMITCTNWDTQRLVVVADLVDSQPLASE